MFFSSFITPEDFPNDIRFFTLALLFFGADLFTVVVGDSEKSINPSLGEK